MRDKTAVDARLKTLAETHTANYRVRCAEEGCRPLIS
jgi:hypothetical protein